MATRFSFTEEEMSINEGLGYPKAYAKLCRNSHLFNPYTDAPPSTFIPYSLQDEQATRVRELNHMFPIIDPEKKPSENPMNYASLLWKQLNHLGNAGFDPAKIRIDAYGNVLYIHADSASPLSWEINHWFPCPRGGMTVPSNLRLLQWQVCKTMQNKLEFLVPWWDLQLGVSVNQFLSIFASKNWDFRSRAFSFLFLEGETEEVNDCHAVDSHRFPQQFKETKRQVGLAPAAIVSVRKDFDRSTLKSIDLNRPLRSNSPSVVARKLPVKENEPLCETSRQYGSNGLKEKGDLDMGNNQYTVIAIARDSLKQREATKKKQTEFHKLEEELVELEQTNETECLIIQELESMLTKSRRKVEKCRRLAEAQSSYKAVLEKMIRDAMHQSVVYKEQIRLSQLANSALMARLEAQRAICDSSEKELCLRLKQRGEMENQVKPWEQARKRTRIDYTSYDARRDRSDQFIPETEEKRFSHKEPRLFGKTDEEEEEEKEQNKCLVPLEETADVEMPEANQSLVVVGDEEQLDDELQKSGGRESHCQKEDNWKIIGPIPHSPLEEDDEEHRRKVGKGNVDKWLLMLLENANGGSLPDSPPQNVDQEDDMTDNIVHKLNFSDPQNESQISKLKASQEVAHTENDKCIEQQNREIEGNQHIKIIGKGTTGKVGSACRSDRTGNSLEVKERGLRNRKEKKRLVRTESGADIRSVPTSPMILGMRKHVDHMKKSRVTGHDEELIGNKFFRTPIAQAIKKAFNK